MRTFVEKIAFCPQDRFATVAKIFSTLVSIHIFNYHIEIKLEFIKDDAIFSVKTSTFDLLIIFMVGKLLIQVLLMIWMSVPQ